MILLGWSLFAVALAEDADGDGWATPADCDDTNPDVHPEPWPYIGNEDCNDIDDNCDGRIDEYFSKEWYTDLDGDGCAAWDAEPTYVGCHPPAGLVLCTGDCDDTFYGMMWGWPETCNGRDDDCDGDVDEAPAYGSTRWVPDDDRDGFGRGSFRYGCAPERSSSVSGDCNDGNDEVNPAATEVCNGIDDDCDGVVDPGCTSDSGLADPPPPSPPGCGCDQGTPGVGAWALAALGFVRRRRR